MIFPFVLLAIFTPVTAILHKKAMSLEGKNHRLDTAYDDDYAVTYFAIISWILLVAFALWAVVAMIVQSIDIVEAVTFPEKFIFEYVSGLIK